MYLSFFGLNEKPFAITPDPRYLYLSERHAEALAHLLYGITEAGGFVQLTGEVGTGKTTIVRSLLAQTPKNAEIALILNPRMTAPEFLLTICEEIGIGVPDSSTESLKDLVDVLSHYLLRAHGAGRRVVLVVDEAQNLAPSVLEQVRLLTNLETNTQKLLQIILIGQPELRELLGRNELRQLAQRITGRYHLHPLSRDETAAYVRHRLRVAGATNDIFSAAALSEIYRLSVGVPRVINVICDRALLGAYSMDSHRVTSTLVRHAASEVFGKRIVPNWLPWAAAGSTVVVLVCATVALWNTRLWGSQPRRDAGQSTMVTAGSTAHSTPAARAADDKLTPVSTSMSAPAAAAAVGTISREVSSLAALLAKHSDETDTDSAFAKLFGLWGIKYTPASTDPCTQASQQGLDCLTQRGSLAQLHLYNRPAILLVNDDDGASHQVVLTHLDDEHARIELGGTTHDIGIGELSRYWFGDFVMLWRPGTSQVKSLSPGMRGADVRWLRESLQHVRGEHSDGPVSDVFDTELANLVREFQRQHRLTVDGIAGVQTQIALASAVAGSDAPLLYVADTHGG
ncbi:MAG: ral secretion pathway protein [Gammaproteobacteria bacterium]|nr:ral secretion pathway protein [Gammaproteobacteria bacterium]